MTTGTRLIHLLFLFSLPLSFLSPSISQIGGQYDGRNRLAGPVPPPPPLCLSISLPTRCLIICLSVSALTVPLSLPFRFPYQAAAVSHPLLSPTLHMGPAFITLQRLPPMQPLPQHTTSYTTPNPSPLTPMSNPPHLFPFLMLLPLLQPRRMRNHACNCCCCCCCCCCYSYVKPCTFAAK